jgi:hypothetical protein
MKERPQLSARDYLSLLVAMTRGRTYSHSRHTQYADLPPRLHLCTVAPMLTPTASSSSSPKARPAFHVLPHKQYKPFLTVCLCFPSSSRHIDLFSADRLVKGRRLPEGVQAACLVQYDEECDFVIDSQAISVSLPLESVL